MAEATKPAPCQVRNKTGNPCPRRAEVEILGVVASRYALLDHGIDEFPPVLDELDRLLELIARSRSE